MKCSFSDWNALPSALICPDHSAEFPEGKYQWKAQYRGDARQTGTDRVDQDVTSYPDGKVGERLLSIQLSQSAPSESGLGVESGADSDGGRDYLQEQRAVRPTEQISGGRTCRRAWPREIQHGPERTVPVSMLLHMGACRRQSPPQQGRRHNPA